MQWKENVRSWLRRAQKESANRITPERKRKRRDTRDWKLKRSHIFFNLSFVSTEQDSSFHFFTKQKSSQLSIRSKAAAVDWIQHQSDFSSKSRFTKKSFQTDLKWVIRSNRRTCWTKVIDIPRLCGPVSSTGTWVKGFHHTGENFEHLKEDFEWVCVFEKKTTCPAFKSIQTYLFCSLGIGSCRKLVSRAH